jgi:hypothetical protein
MRFLYITYSDYKGVENIILVGITPQRGCKVSNGTHSYKSFYEGPGQKSG